MTPVEFKAWFEGFTECLSGIPNKSQWDRIRKRVAEIDGTPVTREVYVDRYWPGRPYWVSPIYDPTCGAAVTSDTAVTYLAVNQGSVMEQFDSTKAMYLLGKQEFGGHVAAGAIDNDNL